MRSTSNSLTIHSKHMGTQPVAFLDATATTVQQGDVHVSYMVFTSISLHLCSGAFLGYLWPLYRLLTHSA